MPPLETAVGGGRERQTQVESGVCPLCDDSFARASWLGETQFAGQAFCYVECLGCRSLFCDPMPGEDFLARMYGPNYAGDVHAEAGIRDPKQPDLVMDFLRSRVAGCFLDYGCGGGHLLQRAAELGWEGVGVEFDEQVAAAVTEQTGCRTVTTANTDRLNPPIADVLHLGDVIEHLTSVNEQMPEILSLLKPGGVLIAQGPLEANANLFTFMLRTARRVKRSRPTQMAPYHVMLATSRGQQTFFERFGLQEESYRVHEVSWPAPSRLAAADVLRPRQLGLFAMRKASQLISSFRPGRWGNRYFYVGRKKT